MCGIVDNEFAVAFGTVEGRSAVASTTRSVGEGLAVAVAVLALIGASALVGEGVCWTPDEHNQHLC